MWILEKHFKEAEKFAKKITLILQNDVNLSFGF